MRTRLGVLFTTVVLAALVALPGTSGAAAAFTVTRTPSGGPDGTNITLNGTCGADNQVSAMLHNKDSDAISVDGQGTYTVGAGGTWHGTLAADLHGQTGQDLDLTVTCGPDTLNLPFFSTAKTTNNSPTVLTALAQNGCAQAFAPGVQYIPCPPHVKGFNTGVLTQLNLYADNGTGGASVAVGDVEGNGTPDIVVGSGPGHAPMVWVFKMNGTPVTSFVPYDPSFKGGVNVAVGDLTGDRKAEIVTGAGSGGGPHVRIFNASGQAIGGFFAYDPAFHGGVNVAVGDTDNDNMGEIVTGAGPGGGPHVRVFDGSGNPVGAGFFAYDPHFVGGVSVAAGLNRIVTGAGRGGGPHVRLFDGAGNPSGGGFFAYDGAFFGGVWVALGPNGIVTGPGSGGGPDVREFLLGGSKTNEFLAYEAAFTAGVKVAALGQSSGGSSSSSGPGGSQTSNPGGITITNPQPGGSVTSSPGGSTTSS
ncbi:MAG TPA: FG-GAP-like repeat-containing protein [Acidimicrobiales bacterium]|nr:FG-GAP-like repeat-containing protein [Acidimicrobiales bacterium]